MTRLQTSFDCASLLSLACHGGAAPVQEAAGHNILTEAEVRAGWRMLFDGESTSGWRVYMTDGMSDGWQVEEGALTRVGNGGDIITEDKFESFELQLEWQIAPGGNSGIMYHVIEGPRAPYETGPEMQVLDNVAHHDGLDLLTSAGACYGLYLPSRDVTRPAGEWNAVRLVIDRGHVEHWLNGTLLCSFDLWSDDWNSRVEASKFKEWPLFGKARSGHISLQDHGDRVAYRNIKLRSL